jgi:hypothetical protein
MKVAAANQRYCADCKLRRWMEFADLPTARKCPGCERKYIAVMGKAMPTCGACLIAKAPMGLRESVEGTCAWGDKCSGEHAATWVYSGRVAVCFPCLTDPAKYKLNRSAVLTKLGG